MCFQSGRENMFPPFAMLSNVDSAKALFLEPFRNRMFKNKYSLYRIYDFIKWQLSQHFNIFILNRKRVNEFSYLQERYGVYKFVINKNNVKIFLNFFLGRLCLRASAHEPRLNESQVLIKNTFFYLPPNLSSALPCALSLSLRTKHWYMPRSDRVTPLTCRTCCDRSLKRDPEDVSPSDVGATGSALRSQCTESIGDPVTEQQKVAESPEFTTCEEQFLCINFSYLATGTNYRGAAINEIMRL